jgi:hypothetical protein
MPDQIKTVGDMFRAIEQEIQDVKDGKLPLETARVVQRGRSLQLKTAELNLQFQRMNKAERKNNREYNILSGGVEEIASENKVV